MVLEEKIIRFASGEMKRLDDKIVYIRLYEGNHFTLEETAKFVEGSLELCENRKTAFLIQTGKNSKSDVNAREYVAKHPELLKYRVAEAYVVNSVYHRFLVNFYITIIRPVTPVKAFDNEADAIKWLNKFFKS